MSEHEKTAVEQLCATMDEKYNRLMNVVYGLIVVIIGAGAIQFVSFGEVKAQLRITSEKTQENTTDIISVQKKLIDNVYIEYLVGSNQKLINILQASPNTHESKNALKEWSDFQFEVMKRANPTRGGVAVDNGSSSE